MSQPPYGKFKPAAVKIGNIPWSPPKKELAVHSNT
jgi:hypothetical protein